MANGNQMPSDRRAAIIVGALFIVGDIAGILSAVVTAPILGDSAYLAQITAHANQITIGALLVLIMGFALAMVPVVIYPVLKRHNEVLALGAVVFRGALETITYIGLVMCWLLLITVSQEYVKAGAPAASYFQTMGTVLLRSADWINQLLAIVFSLGSVIFYSVFYQSKLIPRWLSIWCLIGAILYLVAPLSMLFGARLDFFMAPLAVGEIVFAVWLIVKGLNRANG
jgi:hypothetical protein